MELGRGEIQEQSVDPDEVAVLRDQYQTVLSLLQGLVSVINDVLHPAEPDTRMEETMEQLSSLRTGLTGLQEQINSITAALGQLVENARLEHEVLTLLKTKLSETV